MPEQLNGRDIFQNSDINNPDIDGGTADNTVIGGATPAAGSFTTVNGLTQTAQATGFTIAGGTTSKTLTVSGDAEVGQAWTTPAFDAGDFTGWGSMTWTVEAGDITTFAYIIIGKIMTVSFSILTTTVGGTLNSPLMILIPAGKTATKTIETTFRYSDNGTLGIGYLFTVFGQTTLRMNKVGDGNWSASTNLTGVHGQITFEIN